MSIVKVVDKVKPDEIYNLAAQSHVQVSFDSPEFTADVDATGVLRVLEAVRACHLEKTCKVYQASTSELYGKVEEVPQNENTPFHPYSPYAVAKLYGFWIVKEYREVYNMFCCSGILFNHESERRGETFVTGASTDGAVDRNHSAGRGGAIPSLGEIRNCHINVGTGKELTIRELSELVVKAVGFDGTVEFDASKPDGTMRKLIDVSKLHSLGWTHKVEIEDGVQKLFEWYQASLN